MAASEFGFESHPDYRLLCDASDLRALVLRRYGGPEQVALNDVPQPVAGEAMAYLESGRAKGKSCWQ